MINGPPTGNIIIEGLNASFSCSVRGYPAPVIEWQLNGIAFSLESSANHTHQDGSYLITSDTLLITEVTFEMTGEVTCIGRIPPAVTGDRILDEVNSITTLIVYCELVILSTLRHGINLPKLSIHIHSFCVCMHICSPTIYRPK